MTDTPTIQAAEEGLRILKDATDQALAIKAGIDIVPHGEEIRRLARSERGQFIMAKALALAICAIDKLPRHRRSPSDQADMKRLLWGLFPNLGTMELAEVLAQPVIDRLPRSPRR